MATAEAVKKDQVGSAPIGGGPVESDPNILALVVALVDRNEVAVRSLPTECRGPALLSKAFSADLVEFGTRSYCTTNKIHYEKNDKGIDDVVKTPQYRVESEWSWVTIESHRRQRRKPLKEMLKEDSELPANAEFAFLHVRLTEKGMALAA